MDKQRAIEILKMRDFEVIDIKNFDYIIKDEEINDLITTKNLIEFAKNQEEQLECDNVDCEGNCKDIKPVEMAEEFEGDIVNWCKECRERDYNFIKGKQDK